MNIMASFWLSPPALRKRAGVVGYCRKLKLKSIVLLVLFSIMFFSVVSSEEELISINFEDVDLKVVINFVSKVTGKNFLLDDRVRGKVTIISPTKIRVDEVYAVFMSVLEVKGFISTIPPQDLLASLPSEFLPRRPMCFLFLWTKKSKPPKEATLLASLSARQLTRTISWQHFSSR